MIGKVAIATSVMPNINTHFYIILPFKKLVIASSLGRKKDGEYYLKKDHGSSIAYHVSTQSRLPIVRITKSIPRIL